MLDAGRLADLFQTVEQQETPQPLAFELRPDFPVEQPSAAGTNFVASTSEDRALVFEYEEGRRRVPNREAQQGRAGRRVPIQAGSYVHSLIM